MRQKSLELTLGVALTMAVGIGVGLTGTCAARLAPIANQGSAPGSQTSGPSTTADGPPAVAPSSTRFPLDPDWKAPAAPSLDVAATAIGDPGAWIDPERDYPADARRAGHEGTTGIGFVIGTDGRASDCHIVGSSGDASLDDRSCELVVNNARFKPARDAKGDALAVGSTLRITWRLENSGPQPLNDQLVTMSIVINPNGGLSDCTVRQDFDGKAGLARAATCSGIVPQAVANYLYNLAGTGGDLRVELVSGTTPSETIMAKRVADRAGWRTMMLTSAWWKLSETGQASDCQIGEKRSSGYVIPDLCRVPIGSFIAPDGKDKPMPARVGKSVGIFAQPTADKK